MADGKFGLSIDDIVYSYYGNRSGTVLETKLNGSMKDKATEQERFTLMQWVRDGALQKEYTSLKPQKIIEAKCQMCHNENASTHIKANEAPIPVPAIIINEANIGDNLVNHQDKISIIRKA
jgi:alkylated DNA repair dioxygenase AlkB